MTDSQSIDLGPANAGTQLTHVQMVNTNLPVPPEGTTLFSHENQSLDGDSSASGSVANKTNLQVMSPSKNMIVDNNDENSEYKPVPT